MSRLTDLLNHIGIRDIATDSARSDIEIHAAVSFRHAIFPCPAELESAVVNVVSPSGREDMSHQMPEPSCLQKKDVE
jgi:hypothetical protein